MNSPVHKILVLFGLYSPTFQNTWTLKEQKEHEKHVEELSRKLNEKVREIMEENKKIDLTELNKLEEYLKTHGCTYERVNQMEINGVRLQKNQLIVYENGKRQWDAICHWGSYGHEDGLLEIMGSIVDFEEDGDSVVGWLTADDVIKRIEARK